MSSGSNSSLSRVPCCSSVLSIHSHKPGCLWNCVPVASTGFHTSQSACESHQRKLPFCCFIKFPLRNVPKTELSFIPASVHSHRLSAACYHSDLFPSQYVCILDFSIGFSKLIFHSPQPHRVCTIPHWYSAFRATPDAYD